MQTVTCPRKTGKQRRHSKAFRLKRNTESFQAAKQAELDKAGRRDKPEEITLGEFCKKFVQTCLRNQSYSDQQCYNNTIRQLKDYFGSELLLRRIDRQQTEVFVSSRVRVTKKSKGEKLSGWSRAQHLKHCRALWRRAKIWEFVQENVFDSIKPPDKSTRPWHHLKPAEFKKLLSVAPDAQWRSIEIAICQNIYVVWRLYPRP
ncbi:MAG: phage integrase SAM-like domain-containing protein, partial [Planctomycetota bacterium]